MTFTLCKRVCIASNQRLLIAVSLIGFALAGIPSGTARIRHSPSKTTQKNEEENTAQLLEKIDRHCALALSDHNSGLSIMLERDPIRKEHQLKRIVLAKNKEWRAQATGIDSTLEFFFKTTPFLVYKKNIDRHTRILNRAKKKVLRKCPELAHTTLVKIDDTITKLAKVNDYVTEHDHYLREHASSSGKGSMITGMLFKFIPSPLKFLA